MMPGIPNEEGVYKAGDIFGLIRLYILYNQFWI